MTEKRGITTKLTGPEKSARDLALLVYIIQAISLVSVLPMFVAVIINYVKRPDVRGTLAESHFRWQIRTFWFSLLWGIVGGLTTWLLGIGFLILGINYIWVVYRVVRGWLALSDEKPAYPYL
ncbi:DUF4870 family protein [Biformimicrobium ophioploci]|uniref:Membrane protein n=1 Tax=Biformimicrobium ophioploci TaxID=3036711 RepID=A0ABQ6LUQ0_9GAMM|nr:hypothetical protein [Microbulbifer sp. NKW57]GMG85818.1 membrane protein [Microbulbifer sp. NKW57]